MAANSNTYALEFSDDEREILRIRDWNGAEVFADPEDERYCNFLAWAGAQDFDQPAMQGILAGGYFSGLTRFVNVCKTAGVVLYVHSNDIWRSLSASAECLEFVCPGPMKQPGRFFRLSKSWSSTHGHGANAGIGPQPSSLFVTEKLMDELDQELQQEDSDVRCLSSWPADKTFVYIDVSDYSKYPAAQQSLVIRSLLRIANSDSDYWHGISGQSQDRLIDSICIGDGYIFVFRKAEDGVRYAAGLANIIEAMNARGKLPVPIHYRAGVHIGPVHRFWDIGRLKWNYIGDGINGGNRVLQAIGRKVDDVVYVSSEVRDSINATSANPDGVLRYLQNRGRKADKHGNLWRVYELNHSAMGVGGTTGPLPPL